MSIFFLSHFLSHFQWQDPLYINMTEKEIKSGDCLFICVIEHLENIYLTKLVIPVQSMSTCLYRPFVFLQCCCYCCFCLILFTSYISLNIEDIIPGEQYTIEYNASSSKLVSTKIIFSIMLQKYFFFL